jgi:hypothetical protein
VTRYRPSQAFIGRVPIRPQTQRFRAARIEFGWLLQWARPGRPSWTATRSAGPQYRADFTAEPDIPSQLPNAIITLQRRAIPFTDGPNVGFTEEASFFIELNQPLTWRALMDSYIGPLQNFLTFAFDEPASITRVRLYFEDATQDPPEEQEVEVCFAQRVDDVLDEGQYNRRRLAFPLHDFGYTHPLATILPAWFELCRSIGQVIDLHLGARYRGRTYVETRYIAAVQTLEVLHRRALPAQRVQPQQAFNRQVARILHSVAQGSDRALVQERLAWANEPHLKRRLDDILAAVPSYVTTLGIKRRDFLQRAVDTRNYHTHYDPSLRKRAVKTGPDLAQLAETCRWLATAYIMQRIGFDNTQGPRAVSRNWRVQSLKGTWIKTTAGAQ